MPTSSVLNNKNIKKHLDNDQINLYIFNSIDSTNQYLKDLPAKKSNIPDVCIADHQSKGRGRFGRVWHSPPGRNLYFSMKFSIFENNLYKISAASLVTGLAVIKAFGYLNIQPDILKYLKVKWPNDILFKDRKLCGCLIEFTQPNDYIDLIIGIGINVNLESKLQDPLINTFTSLRELTGKTLERNILAAKIIKTLPVYIKRLIDKGFDDFIDEWNGLDYLKNKTVNINNNNIIGTANGVNSRGELILRDTNNRIHNIYSGEATLKPD